MSPVRQHLEPKKMFSDCQQWYLKCLSCAFSHTAAQERRTPESTFVPIVLPQRRTLRCQTQRSSCFYTKESGDAPIRDGILCILPRMLTDSYSMTSCYRYLRERTMTGSSTD